LEWVIGVCGYTCDNILLEYNDNNIDLGIVFGIILRNMVVLNDY